MAVIEINRNRGNDSASDLGSVTGRASTQQGTGYAGELADECRVATERKTYGCRHDCACDPKAAFG
jgi:hypothetical protein